FAFAGSMILAFSPTFVFIAVQPMSDVLATAWALAAIFAAYRARRGEHRPIWASLAGLAFGIGVLVRPTNAIVLAPLLLALPASPKLWLSFSAGGVPPALFFLAYNSAVFGSPWSTGYQSLLAEGMAWGNFPDRARYYGYWIGRLLTPLVPVGWLALFVDRRAPLRDRAVMISWFAAFLLFYCFYAVYDAWWYTRFLLPGLPALILGALVAARDLLLPSAGARLPRWAIALGVVLVASVLFLEVRFIKKNRIDKFYKSERIYPQSCEMVRRRVPPDGIVASMQLSGALHYYTPTTYAMWNWLLPDRFAELRAATEARGMRWYALLAPYELDGVAKNLPGDWRMIDRSGDVGLFELSPLPR
ncbi:MAG TPA: glycosyltransferase family 39 protein, partial [Thermoanaerobaculia bacterium]